MRCKKCGEENAEMKRCCSSCGAFLEGYTFNNVTAEFGYRGGDGAWYRNKQEYINFQNMSILDEAIKVIGEKELIDRAIEEMAELTVAISHWRRNKCDITAVREEIADVMIASRQLEVIFGEIQTENIREKKIHKFKKEIINKKGYEGLY